MAPVGLQRSPGMSRCLVRVAALFTWGLCSGLAAQRAVTQELPAADSSDLLGRARSTQARFERQRYNLLPWAFDQSGGPCDTSVGRFCVWHDGDDDWQPVPDPPRVSELREELLIQLAEIAATIPGDQWILGQRIFYLGEGGRWDDAADLARACGGAVGWWCDVLEGFALHGAGRYRAAMIAFERGLADMDAERRRRWRDPAILLDGRARDLMNEASEEEWEALRTQFWNLADPLYLMSGNDRLTEHYARRAFADMSDDARNPFGMPWGSDLEELTVRYGWERGWERRRPSPGSVRPDDGIVGHELPGAREFVAPGAVLERPWETEPGAWVPVEHPRSAHVAAYAPSLETGVAQVAVLHRGDSILVASSTRLPEPSDPFSARPAARAAAASGRSIAWEPPALLAEVDQVGLFLIHPERRIDEARARGEAAGVLALSVAAGRYLLSVEAWAPSTGRGGRVRHGIVADTIPEDLATLSDLIIFDVADSLPQDLDVALPLMRPSLELSSGQQLAIGWEIFGLGWRQETLDFELSLYGQGEGFFGKIGRWLGFGGGRGEPLQIGWSEPGPVETGPWFRSVEVDMPELEPGEYLFRLEVSIRGREPLVRTRAVVVSR